MNAMKHLMIKNIPEDLGLNFKALCVLKKTTMREVLIKIMQRWIDEQRGKQ